MDIVLEAFDTFALDRLYAYFLPAFPRIAAKQGYVPDATFTASRQSPTGYHYEPASHFLSFEPSEFAYRSRWPRNNIYRQAVSLYAITVLFGAFIYFLCATLSYFLIYDKSAFNHPKFLKGQIAQEIRSSLWGFPGMALLTVPCFMAELRGFSRMYDRTSEGPGRWYNYVQFPLFIAFTDFLIYWIHRGLHHPLVYKRLHKAHHKWVVPTPFASHAFHPVDGFAQSIPYHIFPFVFPLNKYAYIVLFTFINIWTVMIHDGEYAMNSQIINGAACHTMHHLYFNYNYGQFTTLWDRMGGSYRKPNDELFQPQQKKDKAEWERQCKEMEKIVDVVEGEDNDRVYLADTKSREKKVQ